jgi:hypothetical protein
VAGNLRSPRKRALEIGTNPQGFGDQTAYNPQGGYPNTAGMPSGTYKEQAPAVGGAGEPIQSNPIGGAR